MGLHNMCFVRVELIRAMPIHRLFDRNNENFAITDVEWQTSDNWQLQVILQIHHTITVFNY